MINDVKQIAQLSPVGKNYKYIYGDMFRGVVPDNTR